MPSRVPLAKASNTDLPVDIDWTSEGETLIDAWKIKQWLEAYGIQDADAYAVADAMRVLAAAGQLVEGGWWSQFVVVNSA